ncbi:conserved exported protein of unknown function [Modestobacter italicus]|uniref:Alkaline shock response membrane anchor protein AmaP n=1 Tax=Modestobacter italicus (strain DSM 44449 / CECT 9708 / BC 501) TaxID=2732864 RepID=I4F0U6_MODI5|nr:alkaline shock response membrane anchor protein AmaP [Modestobacter marinus]CCH89259.1 conserved exported protein of unknown function [Modestobacter marinus]
MSSRVNGVNRTLLTSLGVLLLVSGGLGLAYSFGAFGDGQHPLVPQGMRDLAADQPWFWWAVAAVCLLIALLALSWLLAQLRTDRVGEVDLTTDDRDGLTTLHGGALTEAVETETEQLRGVVGASAHLRDRRGQRLALSVDLAEYADIAEVRAAVEDRVVAHARRAVDDPDLPVDVELRPSASRSAGRGLR